MKRELLLLFVLLSVFVSGTARARDIVELDLKRTSALIYRPTRVFEGFYAPTIKAMFPHLSGIDGSFTVAKFQHQGKCWSIIFERRFEDYKIILTIVEVDWLVDYRIESPIRNIITYEIEGVPIEDFSNDYEIVENAVVKADVGPRGGVRTDGLSYFYIVNGRHFWIASSPVDLFIDDHPSVAYANGLFEKVSSIIDAQGIEPVD